MFLALQSMEPRTVYSGGMLRIEVGPYICFIGALPLGCTSSPITVTLNLGFLLKWSVLKEWKYIYFKYKFFSNVCSNSIDSPNSISTCMHIFVYNHLPTHLFCMTRHKIILLSQVWWSMQMIPALRR